MGVEKDIEKAILAYLNRLPEVYARKVYSNAYSSGWLDIMACVQGRMVVIEVKAPGKEATSLQTKEIYKWSDAGAVAFMADNLPRVQSIIAELIEEIDATSA